MMGSTLKFVKGVAVGAAAAYMLDPDRGRARRARLGDQLLAAGRRGTRWAGRRSRYSAGRAKGRALRTVGRGRFEAADDHVLADHLRMALGHVTVATDHVTTEVVEGVVRVRGEVARREDEQAVLSALAGVPGVRRVENLMHLPGEVPPNKAAVIAASSRSTGGPRAS